MGARSHHGKGHFLRGHMCRLVAAYLHLSALRPPLANVPAQRTQQTNARAAGMGDKTAMRPLAKLLWILIFLFLVSVQQIKLDICHKKKERKKKERTNERKKTAAVKYKPFDIAMPCGLKKSTNE